MASLNVIAIGIGFPRVGDTAGDVIATVGAVVSMVTAKLADAAPSLPAASVAFAVNRTTAAGSVVAVASTVQLPAPSTAPVPMTPAPPTHVSTIELLASAVPLNFSVRSDVM